MKKAKYILVLMITMSLVGCSHNPNPNTENKLFFNEVMDTMKENDSFALNIKTNVSINDEFISEENGSYLFNNLYDEKTREAKIEIMGNSKITGQTGVKLVRKDQIPYIYAEGEYTGKMIDMKELEGQLEFLNVNQKYINKLKYKKKERSIHFTLNTTNVPLLNLIFDDLGVFSTAEVSMDKAIYDIVLNKNNTIKSCQRLIEFSTEGKNLILSIEAEFVNYEKQQIEAPVLK